MAKKKNEKILFPLEEELEKIEKERKKKDKKVLDDFNERTSEERQIMESRKIDNQYDLITSRLRILSDDNYNASLPKKFEMNVRNLLKKEDNIFNITKDVGITRDTDTDEIFYFNEQLETRENMKCFENVKQKLDQRFKVPKFEEKEKFNEINSDMKKCEEPHLETIKMIKDFLLLTPEEQEKKIKKD